MKTVTGITMNLNKFVLTGHAKNQLVLWWFLITAYSYDKIKFIFNKGV